MTEVTLADSVTSIGSHAFYSCDSLTEVTLPDGLLSIGSEAFGYCGALSSLTIPAATTDIDGEAFNNCDSLILTVTRGSTAQEFARNHSVRYQIAGEDMVYVAGGQCGAEDSSVFWDLDTTGTLKLTGAGATQDWESSWYATPWFGYRESIQQLEVGPGITRVGNYAFAELDELVSAALPDSLESIGDYGFGGCDRLSVVTLPDTLMELSDSAFSDCPNLMLTVKEGTEVYGAVVSRGIRHKVAGSEVVYLSSGLWGAQKSQIWKLDSSGVLTIFGAGAMVDYFSDSYIPWSPYRSQIQTVTVKDGVTKIGSSAFADCYSLTRVYLPASVELIGASAFQRDENLRSLSLPDGLHSIGQYAFAYCQNLRSLTIPQGVTAIGMNAFDGMDVPSINVYRGSYAQTYAAINGVSCQEIVLGTADVTGVTLDQKTLQMKLGDNMFLTAAVLPEDAKSKKVTWQSDNPGVASVDENGMVSALAEGTANVTAVTADGGKTASCAVTVLERIPVTEVRLSESRKSLRTGESFWLSAEVFPERAYDRSVLWSSSDETVASVTEDGYVTMWAEGTATITAASVDGIHSAQCVVTPYLSATGIQVRQKAVVLKLGGKAALLASVLPEEASDDVVHWTSTNQWVASVSDDGQVTGNDVGTATMIATTNDGGFMGFCLVTVTDEVTSVTGMSLSRREIDALEIGTSMQITAKIEPEDATNQMVSWTSSVPEVAMVSEDGIVTALQPGTAVITAMTADGNFHDACTVQVPFDSNPSGLDVDVPSRLTVVKGSPLNLTGLTVTARYGELRQAVEDYTLSGYDRDALGPQTVTVLYKNQSARFTVTVIERRPVGVSIEQSPVRRDYAVGEPLELDGLILQVAYNDNTVEQVTDLSQVTYVGYSSDAPGKYPVTVTWEGLSAAFYVTVQPGAVDEISAPKMSTAGYPGGKRLELNAAQGAQIYYTLDGSVPDRFSRPYEEAILLSDDATTVKAVAVMDDRTSTVTSTKVTVSSAERPAPGYETGSALPSGTLLTLQTATEGAAIYYTTDGSDPDMNSTRYSSGILLSADMAVPDAETGKNMATIKAIAIKDGYRSSGILEARYELLIGQASTQGSAIISIGSVTSRAGERASAPVYILTEGDAKLTYFRFALCYDKGAFEFVSVTPAEGVDASNLMVSSGVNGGQVTVMFDSASGSPVDSGEVFTLTLKARDSAEDAAYNLELAAQEAITIRTDQSTPLVSQTSGVITLEGSHNSQLTGDITFQNSSGSEISDLQGKAEDLSVNFSLDPYSQASAQSGDLLNSTVDIFIACYDRQGLMVNLRTWNVELRNAAGVAFVQNLLIPPGMEVAKIQVMILSEDLTPIIAPRELGGGNTI